MRILIVVLGGILVTGCGQSSNNGSRGVLDRLAALPDENGNGLADIPVPDGVEPAQAVGLYLASDITRPEAEALARVDVPAAVGNLVDIRADIVVELEYADDVKDRLRGSRSIGPFEIAAEAECPLAVDFRIGLVAELPLVGDQHIRDIGPYRFERDTPGGFECGSVIAVETTINSNGEPVVQKSVQPLDTFVPGE
ncbi:MAG: hypothetical protein JXB13_09565 [Phycisphaerae bacterium]|nr:hypothetical protein [Phycisphaerae bacterium]